MKTCCRCKIEKCESEFRRRIYKNGTIGLRSYCKPCQQAERDAYRASSPKDNDRNKAYNKRNATKIRGSKLAKKYWPHLTWEQAIQEWDRLFSEQNGHCAMCPNTARLHVDHDHNTNVVRGLLCYNCNNGIGRLKDSMDILNSAMKYLSKHKA